MSIRASSRAVGLDCQVRPIDLPFLGLLPLLLLLLLVPLTHLLFHMGFCGYMLVFIDLTPQSGWFLA